jgi:hypothetical protein
MDPLRHPEEIFSVLRSSLGSFSDFFRLLQ